MKKIIILTALILLTITLSACGNAAQDLLDVSFAEARASFSTTLTRNVNTQYRIPEPPEGGLI